MNPLNWFRRNKTTDESIEDSRQISTVLRVIQAILILLVVAYAVYALFFSADLTQLPLLPALPSGWVVLGSFVIGWGIAWIPSRVRRWRMQRDNDRLSKRVEDLEKSLGINKADGKRTLLPDRDPEVSRQQRRGDDDADNILAQEAETVVSSAEEVAENVPESFAAKEDVVTASSEEKA